MLQDKLTEANSLIACVQQENMQLNVDRMLQEKHIMKLKKETKGKSMREVGDPVEHQEQVARQKIKPRGLKKALQQQRKQITVNELIDREISEDKEYWLGKVNDHLEKLLRRANRDKRLQKHMASHYYTRNLILRAKVKQMKVRLSKTLINQKEKGRLDLLVDSIFIA